MRRNALALQIPLNDEPKITIIPDDPDAFDLDDCSIYAVADEPDVIDMIEQEYCFSSATGTHVYLGHSNRCYACGAAHPSIRNACGQR